MADRKIYFEAEFDDKGALGKLRQLDTVFDLIAATASKKTAPAVDGVSAAATRSTSAATASAGGWMRTVAAWTTGLLAAEGIATALGLVYRAVGAVTGIIGSAVTAAQRYNNSFIGLSSVASAFGHDADEAKRAAQELAKDGLMTVGEAAEGLKNLLATRFSMPEAINLMRAFKDSAAFGRQGMLEFGQAVVGATQGLKNQMSQMTDNSGVTKNLSNILVEQGFKVTDLSRVTTDARVRQALYNGILKETIAQTGDATRLAMTYTGQVSRLKATYESMLATWGSAITQNRTLADTISWVNDELQRGVDASTNSGKAFDLVSDAIIGTVKAGIELLRMLDLLQTGTNGVIHVFAELAGGLFNVTAMFLKAQQVMNPALWIGPGAKLMEDMIGQLKSWYEGSVKISNDALSRSVAWGNGITDAVGRLQILERQLVSTRGQTVALGAAQTRTAQEAARAEAESNQERQRAASILTDLAGRAKTWADMTEYLDKRNRILWERFTEDALAAREGVKAVREEVDALDQKLRAMDRYQGPEMDWVSELALLGTEFTTNPEAGRTAAQTFGQSFKSELRGALGDVSSIIIDTLVNKGSWREAATALASRFGAAFGGAIGEYFGGPVGREIGRAIGSLAGPALNTLIGVFTGPSAQVDIRRRVAQSWGVAISDGLAQAIADVADQQFRGNRQAAEVFSLDKILAEAGGLTSANLAGFTARLRDVFALVDQGLMTVAQAATVLDQNWEAFVKAGTDGSGRLNDQLRETLRLAREFGIESKAMAEYMRQQAQTALTAGSAVILASSKQFEGYQKIADAVREAQAEVDKLNQVEARGRGVEWTQQMEAAQRKLTDALTAQHKAAEGAGAELTNLGIIAQATYAAAIAAGMSHAEALKAAGPGLDALSKAYANLGLPIEDAGLKALLLQHRIATANPTLVAGVDALASSFIALANMGMLNEKVFGEMQVAGSRMYERLREEAIAQGATSEEASRHALLLMQNYLHQAEQQARELGIPLDENTQRMIDQSKEMGIWRETGKSANQLLLDGIKDLTSAIQEMIDSLRSVPPVVNSRIIIDREYRDSGEHRDGPTFHSGGYISGSRDRVPITAQAGEFVVSRRGVSAVGLKRLHAINQGTDPGGGRTLTLNVGQVRISGEPNERQVAEKAGKLFVQQLKAQGVRFSRGSHSTPR